MIPCRRWRRAMQRDRERRILGYWVEVAAWLAFSAAVWWFSGLL